ncbi:MAG: dihydropteroate synthase [Alistipes sp.]|nr:dihydropteroate synthase [Alistipes sp.]
MAIVNVTDDSFYAQSRTMSERAVAERAVQAVVEGATILDVGGYSSRPGAKEIGLEQEWQRVNLGLKAIREVLPDVAISIDTFRSEVARRALQEYGPIIINDISAGEIDEKMVDVVAEYDVPYVAMHMRGTPQTMQQNVDYESDVTSEVVAYLCQRAEFLQSRGVHKIILDPGFGFAKDLRQNYELLLNLDKVCDLGYPVLAGLSRKSMIYNLLGVSPSDSATLQGTTVLNWQALCQGASILRVHDVKEAVELIKQFKIQNSKLDKVLGNSLLSNAYLCGYICHSTFYINFW